MAGVTAAEVEAVVQQKAAAWRRRRRQGQGRLWLGLVGDGGVRR